MRFWLSPITIMHTILLLQIHCFEPSHLLTIIAPRARPVPSVFFYFPHDTMPTRARSKGRSAASKKKRPAAQPAQEQMLYVQQPPVSRAEEAAWVASVTGKFTKAALREKLEAIGWSEQVRDTSA